MHSSSIITISIFWTFAFEAITIYTEFKWPAINCTVAFLPVPALSLLWLRYQVGQGLWVAIQHRGEQSLGRKNGIIILIFSRRSALRDAGYIFQVAHHAHKTAEIASPRHHTHCKAIRQQILQYIKIIKQLYCSSAAWRPHNAEVARAYESGPYLASASSVIFYINILPLKVN